MDSVRKAGMCVLVLGILMGGCNEERPESALATNSMDAADQETRQRINSYIRQYMPWIRKGGFPNITMEPVHEGDTWRISICGEVLIPAEQERRDHQIMLEGVLHLTEPPVPLIYKVIYRVDSSGQRQQSSRNR